MLGLCRERRMAKTAEWAEADTPPPGLKGASAPTARQKSFTSPAATATKSIDLSTTTSFPSPEPRPDRRESIRRHHGRQRFSRRGRWHARSGREGLRHPEHPQVRPPGRALTLAPGIFDPGFPVACADFDDRIGVKAMVQKVRSTCYPANVT